MSFRRAVFEEIGGFRSGIGRIGTRPVGCEETELAIRARQRWPRGVILYEPRARVWHRVPAGRAEARYFVSRCYSEGLSKALVARVAGARDGLSAERKYVLQTLPSGMARALRDAVLGDRHGIVRATAIATGFAVTTLGYVVGRMRDSLRPSDLSAGRSSGATRSAHA